MSAGHAGFSFLTRGLKNSAIKYGHGGNYSQGSVPGENLPINLDWGKGQWTLVYMLFFGIPLAAPWLITWRQLTRK